MSESDILQKNQVQRQLAELDAIMYKNLYKASHYYCMFPHCKERAINSHTVPENMLRKIDPDLKKILYFMSGFIEEQKMDISTLFKPIHADRFSTFPGFCVKHDNQLFREIDNFDGAMNKKKALLIHYRNVCYGIAQIKAMLKQEALLRNDFCESKSVDHWVGFLKSGHFARKLKYCLDTHIERKIIMERMLADENYEQINFREFIGNISDPIFSGRSGRLLNRNENVYKTSGYNLMPWVTYMTLISNIQNHVFFCWLEIDRQYSKRIVQISSERKFQDDSQEEKKLRWLIAAIAYCEADAVAIHIDSYEQHKSSINSAIEEYTNQFGRHRQIQI